MKFSTGSAADRPSLDCLENGLYQADDTSTPRWVFVMLNPEQMRFMIKATNRTPRPLNTLRVWNVCLTYVKKNTGEIMVGREQLAKDAETTVHEVSRAMGELTRIGALIREKQGCRITYYVNPRVGWNGGEDTRQKAARNAPKLQASR